MKIKAGDAVILTVNGVIHYYKSPIITHETYPKQTGVISLFNMHFDTDGVMIDVNRNASGNGVPAVWRIYNAKDVTHSVIIAHNKQKQINRMLAEIIDFAENADDFSMIELVHEQVVKCKLTLEQYYENVPDDERPIHSIRVANEDGTLTPIFIYKQMKEETANTVCYELSQQFKDRKFVVI